MTLGFERNPEPPPEEELEPLSPEVAADTMGRYNLSDAQWDAMPLAAQYALAGEPLTVTVD